MHRRLVSNAGLRRGASSLLSHVIDPDHPEACVAPFVPVSRQNGHVTDQTGLCSKQPLRLLKSK